VGKLPRNIAPYVIEIDPGPSLAVRVGLDLSHGLFQLVHVLFPECRGVKATARPEYAADLAKRPAAVRHVLEHEVGKHGVNRAVG
jgi:hypothetical protein